MISSSENEFWYLDVPKFIWRKQMGAGGVSVCQIERCTEAREIVWIGKSC